MATDRTKGQRCSRSLAEQLADRSGAIRRTDHPRGEVHSIDLLPDDLLDRLRKDHPGRAAGAFDAYDALVEQLHADRDRLEAARDAAEKRAPNRPMLAVAVCIACGAHDVATFWRPWPVDRAMRRTGLGERDVLEIVALLAAAWQEAPPDLDSLSTEALLELRDLVGKDVDLVTLREQYDPARRSGEPSRQVADRTSQVRGQ